MKLIEELRQRPEEERLAFAALAAGIIALFLFLVWGVTFFRSAASTPSTAVSNQQGSALQGLQTATEDARASFDTLSTQYAQLQTVLNNVEQGTAASSAGTEAVQLSTGNDGTVYVDNIIIEKNELGIE